MYEHKTLFADDYPNAKNLDDLDEEGWEMFMMIPKGEVFVCYLRRMKQSG